MTLMDSASERTSSLPSRLRVRVHDAVPVVMIPEGVPFEPLREWIRTRMPEALAEISGRAVRLDLGDRELELFDVRRLLHLLRDEFQLDVTGLYVRPAAIHRYAERELKLRLFAVGEAPEVPVVDVEAPSPRALPGLADALAALAAARDEDPASALDLEEIEEVEAYDPPETREPTPALRRSIPLPDLAEAEEPEVDDQGGRRVLSLRRTLRSGGLVRYDGDVHILGDVNAGAQIRAGGSVVVLGRLRGMVHAGANGDATATVLAFDLSPTQLRIAHHIATMPPRVAGDAFAPELARVEGDGIVLEPLKKK